MDDDRIEELENQCRKVVRAANAAGEIDAATFTIAEARKRVGGCHGDDLDGNTILPYKMAH
jgi:hypothetical protein